MGGSPPNRTRENSPCAVEFFESFPDPVLGYAPRENSDGRSAYSDAPVSEGRTVVRAHNAAFQRLLDTPVSDLVGTPLERLEVPGTVGGTGSGDESPEDDDSASRVGTRTSNGRSLLERARAEPAVRLSTEVNGEMRHFNLRDVPANADSSRGCLLFTDVTEVERDRREAVETAERFEAFASATRHDIRNPLEVTKIRLEAARETGEAAHFEKVFEALDRIERITKRRLGSEDRGTALTDEVALETVARSAWEMVDTRDATLIVEDGLQTVRGDTNRLRGLFENLFRNAVEHAGPEVTVTVGPLPEGFVVVDDGPGIAADVMEHVFESGYSTIPGNSGLGLAIVREVAERHGWQVSLAATEDGARFEFTE